MIKVLTVISKVYDSKEFEGLVEHWDRSRGMLEFLFLNEVPDSKTQRVIRAKGFTSTTIVYRGWLDIIPTLFRVIRHLRRTRPDVVHANLLEASFLALLAGRITGIGRLVYTRHHTTHNHKYHPIRGVLYDRIINALAHHIVAITRNVAQVLVEKEGVPPEKISLIHHGFELDAPAIRDEPQVQRLRNKYGLATGVPWPVIGVISRPFEWKGLDHVIPAFRTLLERWPDARLMLFHWTSGAHSARYERMLAEIPAANWRTVVWETEMDALYHVFDTFVHVPEDAYSEAFGYVYVEALNHGVPSVMTSSGIITEFAHDQLNGVRIVPFKDPKAIADAMRYWIERPCDAEMRIENARVNTKYMNSLIGMSRKMNALHDFYGSITVGNKADPI